MPKPPPRWSVPIASIGCDTSIDLDEHDNVRLWTPNSEVGPDTLTPLEATQLGMALQDAGREAGQRAAKRKR